MVISYEELRHIKDSLPDGSMHHIADKLHMDVDTIRNYFGGYNYRKGQPTDIHYEKGINGGLVRIDDPRILELAKQILSSTKEKQTEAIS